MATLNAPLEVPEHVEAQRKTKCPNNVLLAIYGNVEDKKKAYDHSLTRYRVHSSPDCILPEATVDAKARRQDSAVLGLNPCVGTASEV